SKGERCFSGSAFAPRIQRRSTGSECKSLYCLRKYCPCGSSLRRSDTGSPNNATCADLDHCAPRSLCALRLSWAEAYRCKTSHSHQNHIFKLHAGLNNTPRRLSLFQYFRGRSPSVASCFTITVEATTHVTIEVAIAPAGQ